MFALQVKTVRELRAERDELRRAERGQQIKHENQEALEAQVEAHAKDTQALLAACSEMEEAVEMAVVSVPTRVGFKRN